MLTARLIMPVTVPCDSQLVPLPLYRHSKRNQQMKLINRLIQRVLPIERTLNGGHDAGENLTSLNTSNNPLEVSHRPGVISSRLHQLRGSPLRCVVVPGGAARSRRPGASAGSPGPPYHQPHSTGHLMMRVSKEVVSLGHQLAQESPRGRFLLGDRPDRRDGSAEKDPTPTTDGYGPLSGRFTVPPFFPPHFGPVM